MSTLVWLEHVFAEAEAELDALVSKVTAWRCAAPCGGPLTITFRANTFTDAPGSWRVEHGETVLGIFVTYANAYAYAKRVAARIGAMVEDGEIPL